jgi:PLP dependent protein
MDNALHDQIAGNLAGVQQRIAAACRRAGRRVEDVTLVAVTKTVSPDHVRVAYDLGLANFGENRVQEAHEKILSLRDLPLCWHMIGHLQSNKAAQAVDLFQIVHSVDCVEIAQHLSRRALARGSRLPVLLELNIAGEASKFGFRTGAGEADLSALLADVERILTLPGLDVQGLMTVAPMTEEPEMVRPYFHRLHSLRDLLRSSYGASTLPHLSMGMTDDFEVAIEEGATMIRLGRAIFGPRPA